MRNSVKGILVGLSLLILAAFMLFVVNQTAGIVHLVAEFNPVLGKIILYTLLALYALIVLVPLVLFIHMPRTMIPPDDTSSDAYTEYLSRVRRRLGKNPRLADIPRDTSDMAYLELALTRLNAEADTLITSSATTVFITTAISQNGLLDGIMVLVSLARLIWTVAHTYYQRPSLKELVYLYANVAATTFLVVNIEDLDVDEQVELIITRVMGSSFIGGIPGATGLSTFLTTSFINGSVNALLTLRVGIIAKTYLSFRHQPRRQVKRAASFEAARMFGGVFVKASGIVTGAVVRTYRKHAGAVTRSVADAAIKSVESVAGAVAKAGAALKDFLSAKTPGENTTNTDTALLDDTDMQ